MIKWTVEFRWCLTDNIRDFQLFLGIMLLLSSILETTLHHSLLVSNSSLYRGNITIL